MKALLFGVPIALVAVGLMAGCGHQVTALSSSGTDSDSPAPAAGSAEALIKWSMDKHKAMTGFSADAAVTVLADGKPASPPQRRTIHYLGPNFFRIEAKTQNGIVLTSVSDGRKQVEYANQASAPAASYPAPDSLGSAATTMLGDPGLCGSMLYRFFQGSAGYASVVDDSKGAPTLGEEQSGDGENARVVKFYGADQFGHVEALIGEKTGHVYRFAYDMEPRLKAITEQYAVDPAMKKKVLDQIATMKPGKDRDELAHKLKEIESIKIPKLIDDREIYSHVASNHDAILAKFDTTLPKGVVAVEVPSAPTDQPPVPIGHLAPDFEVAGLDGKPVKLSSLRGHVVLLDFWATWCPPCKKGLPETARLAKVGASQGLQVLAISAEQHDPVANFLKGQSYQLPAFIDANRVASDAYKADAIPTTAIIDAKGQLSAYFVGLQDPSTLRQALAKAGVTVGS